MKITPRLQTQVLLLLVAMAAIATSQVSGAPAWPGAAAQPAAAVVRQDPLLAERVGRALSLRSASVQTLSIVEPSSSALSTRVIVDGQQWTLDLQRHSVRSADFRVLVQTGADPGVLEPHPAPPVLTYRGTIREFPGAEVRASMSSDGFKGVIFTQSEILGIQPVRPIDRSADAGDHVVYKNSDIIHSNEYKCGTFDGNNLTAHALEPMAPIQPRGQEGSGAPAGTGLKIADVALDADFEFYQLNGSSVPNTIQDMEDVINGLEPYYEVAGIGITYEVTTVIVRTTAGAPYTSTDPEVLLENQFRATWMQSPQTFIRRDTAHLFTGKNIDSSTIGIAYLSAICSTNIGYGLSQSRFSGNFAARLALTAHEIGHNWSAPHCDGCSSCTNCCRIMCSGLGGCTGILTSFGCEEVTVINNFKNTRSCLSDQRDTQTVPFFADFGSGVIDNIQWSYNNGAVISTASVSPPSGPNAVELDAAGIESHRDDDLRTNFIDLTGQTGLRLSYYTQHRGPESGEALVIEYWQVDYNWVELNRVISDGSMQTTFTLHTHTLPANAYHNEFRVRFRTEADETNDKWYIDDVIVTAFCANDGDCNDLFYCNGEETCGVNGCVPGTAPCGQQLCRESDNMCVECLSATDCTDGVFCNGAETCNVAGECFAPSASPCTSPVEPVCDEANNRCVGCITNEDCSDGLFCNGTETCFGVQCSAGTNPCPGQACLEPTDECVPPGDMVPVLQSSGAVAGGFVNVFIFADSVDDVKSFQTEITVTRTSGTGSVTVNCPGGVSISKTRPDYIFGGLDDFSTINCGQKRASSQLISGFVIVGATPVYLSTYKLTVSVDAAVGSTFDVAVSNQAYLRNSSDLTVIVNRGTTTLTIVDTVCDPPTVAADGCRAVEILPANNPTTQAFRITSPDWTCLNKYVQADGSLGASAVFQTAAAWGTVSAGGPEITPSATYEVRAECGSTTSATVAAVTEPWGETNSSDPVDLGDILCVLEGYNSVFTNCSLPSVDLAPCDPDGTVELGDISAVLGAYAGSPFVCPPVCP